MAHVLRQSIVMNVPANGTDRMVPCVGHGPGMYRCKSVLISEINLVDFIVVHIRLDSNGVSSNRLLHVNHLAHRMSATHEMQWKPRTVEESGAIRPSFPQNSPREFQYSVTTPARVNVFVRFIKMCSQPFDGCAIPATGSQRTKIETKPEK